MRIKKAAGWNQTETDWRNLLQLAPDTSFGVECDGTLAATATAICYGRRLAWIGMVLTDPEYRRRGFARRLVEHSIEALTARGIQWIKLDATDMGAPLYRQLGFADEGNVERWRSVVKIHPAGTADNGRPAGFNVLDRAAFGTDRTALLAALAPLGVAAIEGQGYAMARSGSLAAYFGPSVARRPEAAGELLVWFLSRHPGETVFWDLLPSNPEAVRLARAFGFESVRRLVRMVRRGIPGAPPVVHDDSKVFAIAGFEYG